MNNDDKKSVIQYPMHDGQRFNSFNICVRNFLVSLLLLHLFIFCSFWIDRIVRITNTNLFCNYIFIKTTNVLSMIENSTNDPKNYYIKL